MKLIKIIVVLGVLLLPVPTLYAQDFLQKANNYLDAGECDKAQRAYEAYKVEHPYGNAEVERRIAECGKQKPQTSTSDSYVDLGLPSGTLWKSQDESGGLYGLYDYFDAFRLFGNRMPSPRQWNELINCCSWTYFENNSCFKVQGPNHNCIFLPLREQESKISYKNGEGTYTSHVKEICGNYWAFMESGSSVWVMYYNRYGTRIVEEKSSETKLNHYKVHLVR
ncbi:MAG: hypothetical protein IKN78_01420 [Bacteroidales bacterium]|nr:hypothetical protein [Bacteroidales bacterium]